MDKQKKYCLNCNKYFHNYKNCNHGIISNGIISFNITNYTIDFIKFEKFLNNNLEYYIKNKKEIINTNINESIKFLLVQRNHSLGFGELIRGHYEHKKIESINYIIKQMNINEIESIKNKNFNDLWNYYWGGNGIKNQKHLEEFKIAEKKFNYLKITYKMDDLVNSEYTFNEWGFPKGRRELYEENLACALREFKEETNIQNINYVYIYKSIQENLIGTNNIKYIHNYFISNIDDNIENNSNNEIEEIKLLSLSECLQLLRPYHKDKINIVKILYNILNDFIKIN